MTRWGNRIGALARTAVPRVDACPVGEEDRRWIDGQLIWLAEQFGTAALRRPMVLPTVDFFPDPYQGRREDVPRLLDRVAELLGTRSRRIDLEFYADAEISTAGHYRQRDGRPVIAIEESGLGRPNALIATIAHELCHDRLIGEGRILVADRPDHERLTDLAAVYLGFGVFSANARTQFQRGEHLGVFWLGYLTERMYGYALARCAWLREEFEPAWAQHLDLGPRSAYELARRYLATHG